MTEDHIEKDPIEARQGSPTKVSFVILIVSTLAAAAGLFVLLSPALRL
jgi:hypothetical protein